MRVLTATATAITLAAAAAAALALHSHPARPPQPTALAEPAPPGGAAPGRVWRSGTATLRLQEGPCASEDLVHALEAEGFTQARAYEVMQGRHRYSGCWATDIDGDVVTIEPGREIGSIPADWFHAAAGG